MQVKSRLILDLQKKPTPQVEVMQNDALTRAVTVALYDNGVAWAPPTAATVSLAFEKPDKTSGWYDTLPTGEAACTIDGNEVTIVLAPEVLTAPGVVYASAVFRDADFCQLATFPFRIWVERNPTAKSNVSNSYYRYSSLAEVNDAIDTLAPGIKVVAKGSPIVVTDAAGKKLQSLRVLGKTVQNGTPTPEAPIPLMTAGANGSITLAVEPAGQSLVLDTPGGLHGLPMEDSCTTHNFVDKTGKKWLTDEIDLTRGVYVQRCFVVTFDGSENWEGESTKSVIGETTFPAMKGAQNDANQCYHLCSHFQSVARRYGESDGRVTMYGSTRGATLAFVHNNITGLETWKAYLAAQAAAGTPVTVVLVRTNPVETELPAEVVEQYRALYTTKGETTISNDGSAFMEMSYMADTKLYIDQKLAAISAAILNN